MKKVLLMFVFLSLLLTLAKTTYADYNCTDIGVAQPPLPTPQVKHCIETRSGFSGQYKTMRECLYGTDDINHGPLATLPCKDDPRYQLRNFAPMLNFPTIGSMLNLGVALITTIAGLMCGVIMFYGAYKYLSAGGEMKKIEEARNRMIYAGIGLLVVLLAYSIVKVLLDITSTNTVGF